MGGWGPIQDYQRPMSGLSGKKSGHVRGQQCNDFYKMAYFSFCQYILTEIV